jgi:hypothetical protein
LFESSETDALGDRAVVEDDQEDESLSRGGEEEKETSEADSLIFISSIDDIT